MAPQRGAKWVANNIHAGWFVVSIGILTNVVSVIAFFTWLGWGIGAVEAVALSILVGTSVDYLLHLTESFLEAGEVVQTSPNGAAGGGKGGCCGYLTDAWVGPDPLDFEFAEFPMVLVGGEQTGDVTCDDMMCDVICVVMCDVMCDMDAKLGDDWTGASLGRGLVACDVFWTFLDVCFGRACGVVFVAEWPVV
jgi:hypothetical protein